MRSAPSDGYDFGNKRQYRRDVWSLFRRHCPVPRSEARALLMPSTEGDEVDVALANGFRECNLYVVDRNPAIVAHLKRRYRRINTFGLEAWDACMRAARKGLTFHCVNLDFTGPLSFKLLLELAVIARCGVVRPPAIVAVTVLRGREEPLLTSMLLGLGDEGRERHIRIALDAIACCHEGPVVVPKVLRSSTYRSVAGTQTMRWVAIQYGSKHGLLPSVADDELVGYMTKTHNMSVDAWKCFIQWTAAHRRQVAEAV